MELYGQKANVKKTGWAEAYFGKLRQFFKGFLRQEFTCWMPLHKGKHMSLWQQHSHQWWDLLFDSLPRLPVQAGIQVEAKKDRLVIRDINRSLEILGTSPRMTMVGHGSAHWQG